MLSIIFALSSYVTTGIGQVFYVMTTRRLGAYSATFWLYFLEALIFSLYLPFAIADLSNFTLQTSVLIVVLATVSLVANLCANTAFQMSNASIVGTITGSFPAVTVILSVIFLGEHLTWQQVIAIGAIFCGLIIANFDFKDMNKALANKAVWLALVAMVSWGIENIFIKVAIQQVGWFWPLYISVMIWPLILVYGKLSNKKLMSFAADRGRTVTVFLASVLLVFGNAAFFLAINYGRASIVAPIAGSAPTLFILLSYIFFKEPLTKQQIVGIVTTLAGIVALSFLSV